MDPVFSQTRNILAMEKTERERDGSGVKGAELVRCKADGPGSRPESCATG